MFILDFGVRQQNQFFMPRPVWGPQMQPAFFPQPVFYPVARPVFYPVAQPMFIPQQRFFPVAQQGFPQVQVAAQPPLVFPQRVDPPGFREFQAWEAENNRRRAAGLPLLPSPNEQRAAQAAPAGGAGAVGGAGAAIPAAGITVPGNIAIVAGAGVLPALVGGRIVSYRDRNDAGVRVHMVSVRPRAGGAVQWHELDARALGLNEVTQNRIILSARLVRQAGLDVAADGTITQFREDAAGRIRYDIRNNGDLVSRAQNGIPRLVHRYNPAANGRAFQFVELAAVGGAPVPHNHAFNANPPANELLLPLGSVTDNSALSRAGLPVGTLYCGEENRPIRIFNPAANAGVGAWETPRAPLMPATTNQIFGNGTFRWNRGNLPTAGVPGRQGDAVARIPAGRQHAGCLVILNNNGNNAPSVRIVNATTGAQVVGPTIIATMQNDVMRGQYQEYANSIVAAREANAIVIPEAVNAVAP